MKSTPTSPNVADKFVLLFSADWFQPHWRLTGFVPRPRKGAAFQQEMRELVERMMGGETLYWYVNFSEARFAETCDGFLAAIEEYHSGDSKLGLIREMVAGELSNEAVTEVSMAFWENYEAALHEIRRADLTATAWDQHLVGLTPDLPSLLQDFVCVDVLRVI